jgi:hypothetical protein
VSPPAIAKQRHLLNALKSRGHRIFIEAGTYKGATTAFFVKGATTAFFVPHVDQ